MHTHQEVELRSLALHRLVAEKIRRDPALMRRAEATLRHWRTRVSPASQPYIEDWERLVHQGLDVCLAIAVEDSPRATALRQCSPFTGVLTHQERFSFLRDWGRAHAARTA